MGLAERVTQGDVQAVARLIRHIDDGASIAVEELKKIFPNTGNAYIIGITGSPGVGKSTLVDKIIGGFRNDSKTVGVIALDPTSPFTGGAILGDRIRMQAHSLDKGVFIRSLATRGCLGGLSYSTNDVIKVMDAMGKDLIIIETVGVGQSEVDIVNSCHTSIVVLTPGLGDGVQMIKAGILEIGDIFVINKADKEGAERVETDLNIMLDMSPKTKDDWKPPIYKTVASRDEGVTELVEGIYEHKRRLVGSEEMEAQIKENLKLEFMKILQNRVMKEIVEKLFHEDPLERVVDDFYNKSRDPYSVAEEAIQSLLKEETVN